MDKEELKIILQEGEGYKTEFKENVSGVDKDIVAFANSSGGKILVGVTDKGEVKGIKINNEIKTRIQDIVNNCRPVPEILLEGVDNVLIVNVREGTDKPYECSSVFTVVLFKDKEGTDIIDRKEIGGSLFEIIEEVMKFIRLYSKVAYRFTGMPQRENVYEYPFEAIREAVINSVMHKDYFEHGHNNILRFLPGKIRIENYWSKPPAFVLGKTVFRRNQVIADLFARIHFGEKLGTGFGRIKEICKKENAPFPDIEFNENYFYVTFRQSKEYLELAHGKPTEIVKLIKEGKETTREELIKTISENFGSKLVENQLKILVIISKNPNITKKRLAEILAISTTAVDKNIAKLKSLDLLKRVGPDKGGYWKIISERNGGKHDPT